MASYQIVTGGTTQPGQLLPTAELQAHLSRLDKTGKSLEEIKNAVDAEMIAQGHDAAPRAAWRNYSILRMEERIGEAP